MDLHVNDKSAIITGAAQGIGKEIAAVFLEEGCNVALVDIKAPELTAAASELQKLHPARRVDSFQCNITDEAAVQETFQEIGDKHGIDYLVNNAGISEPAPIGEMSAESWRRVLDVNLNAAFLTTRAAFPYMKQSTRGPAMITIGSFAGKRGTLFGNNVSYAASKAGIIGLTKALVPEAAAAGIRVASICPGIVQTDMVLAHPEEKRRELAGYVPLGVLATPREIAAVVVFLCSQAASHIMGAILDVNGGLYLD